MLAPYRPNFIEKIITDSFGRNFRVVFSVTFIDGEARGRVISAQEIKPCPRLSGNSINQSCLPGAIISKKSPERKTNSILLESPYFSLEYLITSQPTRAPSLI